MCTSWQDSWEAFSRILEDKLDAGATPEMLAQYFGGKIVQWNGIIEHKSIDDLAPLVDIALQEVTIHIGDGRTATLDGVSLPVADETMEDWDKLAIGTKVRFSAVLGVAESPFPPIEIKHLKSGRSVVMIRLTNATLVNHA